MNNSIPYIGFFIAHTIFLNYAIFGGLLASSKTALMLHAAIFPLTILHWKTNNSKCVLTELEHKFVKNTKYEEWVKKYPLFTQRYVSLFGIHMEENDINRIVKAVFFITWCITLFKLFSLYR